MDVKLWKDKSKKQIDPDLFSSIADELAKIVYREQKASKGEKANKPTQIRKFYDEVLRFDSMLKTSPSEFENHLPYIKMLNAKAAYAQGRDLVSVGFKNFISSSLKQITDKEDFKIFADFFEAFMGYYKFYDEKGIEMVNGGRR